MKLNLKNRSEGVALIMVMIAILSLSIMAGIYAYSMKVEARLAMNSNNDAEMEWMGRSGMEVAKWILAEDMKMGPVDSLDDFWAGGTGGPAMSNSPLAGFSMTDIPLGKGTITIEPMIDLERKANINMVPDSILEQALILMGVDAGEYPSIVNSIRDWIDPDNVAGIEGAEDDYYQAGDPPYYAKNGPIDDMSELLLIRGITPDLYYGPKVNNYVPSRALKSSQTRLGFNADVPVYPVGFVDLFTPISSGKININTASAEVLQLLPNVDENTAQEIIRLRRGPFGDANVPLQNTGELINANIPPQLVQQIAQFCDVRSSTFEVHVKATIAGYTRRFRGILIRNNPRDIRLISFRAEVGK